MASTRLPSSAKLQVEEEEVQEGEEERRRLFWDIFRCENYRFFDRALFTGSRWSSDDNDAVTSKHDWSRWGPGEGEG